MWQLLIPLIPLLPFVAFIANGLFGRQLKESGGWLAFLCMAGSAVIGVSLFLGALTGALTLPIRVELWTWMAIGELQIPVNFYVDQLTCLMLGFVTFVASLVFLYSIGYMHGDPGFNRFFAYLSLFAFSMLVLVLAESLPLLFVGWEGVGLCSYLLISYYIDMPGAADAGKKAFIVNRIGDFGVLVAMLMLFYALGTLSLPEIAARVADPATRPELLAYGGMFVTWVTLALFLGCTGKSAQIPLFVWLPDAMAGPTPVSALIHAATMVTAGVYLVVRMSVLFALAPATMVTIAVIGALTAFVAGSIAITQRDIKKVLAYSTVSQLGYMFLACGVGAFVAGIFHVFTHAFFKACLFLGAGSVIHACHHIQNLDQFGGLKKNMPRTRWTYLIAALSLAGAPLLAGFMSKDEILWKTFSNGFWPLYLLGLLTAFFTAIYAMRSYFLTFEGESRLPHDVEHHVHESPPTMTIPLILLAIGAVFAGLLNILPVFGHGDWSAVNLMLAPVVAPAMAVLENEAHLHAIHSLTLEIVLIFVSIGVALLGILTAWKALGTRYPERARGIAAAFGPAYRLSANRWWWDDFYNSVVVGALHVVAKASTLFDRYIIDGILHGLAATARGGSHAIRHLQNGQVQAYALWIVIGVNIVLLLVHFIHG